jgi:hypothetical protein
MPAPINLSGRRFDRLVARSPSTRRSNAGRAMRRWACDCDCGKTVDVPTDRLISGETRSCGCLKSNSPLRSTHGHAHRIGKSDEYTIWTKIKDRCLNQKSAGYPGYGGRGITVCEEWQDSFEAFFAHAGPRTSKKHSIDRINNDGNYEPGNVRWATASEQATNRRKRKPGYKRPNKSPPKIIGWNSLKTHCTKGHPYAGANLRLRPHGKGRVCKECHRLLAAARRAKGRSE